jgi:PAS domain S-box-containing protein
MKTKDKIKKQLNDERKAQGKIRESELLYRALFKQSPDGILIIDNHGDFIDFNETAHRQLGYSRGEFKTLHLSDIDPFQSPEEIQASIKHVLDTGNAEFDVRHRTKRGEIRDVHVITQTIDLSGQVFYTIWRDITERKHAEKKLRESEDKFRSIFEQATDGIMIADAETKRNIEANKAMCGMLGYTHDEIIGLSVDDIHPKGDLPAIRDIFEKQLRNEISLAPEVPMLRKDGSVFYAEINATRVILGGKQFLVGIFRDITERIEAEQALRYSNERLRQVLRVSHIGVFDHDHLSDIIYWSPQQREIYGWGPDETVTLQAFLDCIYHKDRARIAAAVRRAHDPAGDGLFDVEHRIIRRDGSIRWLTTRSQTFFGDKDGTRRPVRTVGAVRDITESKRAEEERVKLQAQLTQAQKMESVGLLAGGVAHDFNNILTAIIGYSHLSLTKLPSNDPVRLNLEQILESSNRAAVLTQSLLAFSRRQPINLAVIDLNLVIKEFEKFIHRLIREDITLETVCTGGVLSVMADRGQIEHVIMNLVTNARDAMPHGGKLRIETGKYDIDREFIETYGYGEAGEYALVSVSDTGIGMDEQTRLRIFEPFFTTKEQGKGTGLGLSMVYGTVKQHNGYINVYSEPGKGTTLKIYLPRVYAAMRVDQTKAQDSIVRGGRETILVAEDDAAIRKLSVTVLGESGYTIIEAVNGADAVSRFIENKDNIKLIILDGIMPKMNGPEAYKEIIALSPKMRCIFISGYTGEVFAQDNLPTGTEFLPKPVKPTELLSKVRELLDRA